MTLRAISATLAAPVATAAARVALGALWLHEGIFKYTAGFGRADIALVADGAQANSRVPGYFTAFSGSVLHSFPGIFGFAIPLLETTLGILLILGVLTLPAAIASSVNLIVYWSSDQLITQYPIMAVLSVIILVWPGPAARFSLSALVIGRSGRARRLAAGPLGRWL